MAATTKKGGIKGGRLSIQFGSKKNKKTGKTVALVGRSKEATLKALGLSGSKTIAKPKAGKDKKGRQIITGGTSNSIGTQKVLVQDTTGKWRTIRMPVGSNRAKALAILGKSAKVAAFKYPGGKVVRLKDAGKKTTKKK
jgi:hypothetical protein